MSGRSAVVYLDSSRRLVLYPGGGHEQEEKVPGIGWVLANEGEWADVPFALPTLAESIGQCLAVCPGF